MAGVYHLKNWQFIRDELAISEGYLLERALWETGLPSKDMAELNMVARTCSKARTKEGLEACLVLMRDSISPAFEGERGQIGAFEKFLEALDKVAEEQRRVFYEQHAP